jgi:hypothetical protein
VISTTSLLLACCSDTDGAVGFKDRAWREAALIEHGAPVAGFDAFRRTIEDRAMMRTH